MVHIWMVACSFLHNIFYWFSISFIWAMWWLMLGKSLFNNCINYRQYSEGLFNLTNWGDGWNRTQHNVKISHFTLNARKKVSIRNIIMSNWWYNCLFERKQEHVNYFRMSMYNSSMTSFDWRRANFIVILFNEWVGGPYKLEMLSKKTFVFLILEKVWMNDDWYRQSIES